MTNRFLTAALALLAMLAVAPGSRAAPNDLSIAAFFGTFQGGGVAQNRDSLFFGVTARDFDVIISPAPGNGFRIRWVSVIRKGGSPTKPKIRRKSSEKTLSPAGAANMFRCSDSGDPLRGGELCWARIRGNTLSMFLLSVDSQGSYELQQYDRTVSGVGMRLVFSSHRDGEEIRTVTGHLALIRK